MNNTTASNHTEDKAKWEALTQISKEHKEWLAGSIFARSKRDRNRMLRDPYPQRSDALKPGFCYPGLDPASVISGSDMTLADQAFAVSWFLGYHRYANACDQLASYAL